MTIHIVVAVRDTQLAAFGRPFCTPTTGAAMRSFADETNNRESVIHQHPEDFQLYQLGTFDDEEGTFKNMTSPRQLAQARDVLIKEQPNKQSQLVAPDQA